MKKQIEKKESKKPMLRKEMLRKLNADELQGVRGGLPNTIEPTDSGEIAKVGG